MVRFNTCLLMKTSMTLYRGIMDYPTNFRI